MASRQDSSTKSMKRRTNINGQNKNGSKSNNKKNTYVDKIEDNEEEFAGYSKELIIWLTFIVSILLLLCVYNLCGPLSGIFGTFLFGLFGFTAYFFPFVLFFSVGFYFMNVNNKRVSHRIAGAWALFWVITAMFQHFATQSDNVFKCYVQGYTTKSGGGFFGGCMSMGLAALTGRLATTILLIVFSIMLIVFITGKMIASKLVDKGADKYNEFKTEQQEVWRQKREEHAVEKEKAKERRRTSYTFPKEKPVKANSTKEGSDIEKATDNSSKKNSNANESNNDISNKSNNSDDLINEEVPIYQKEIMNKFGNNDNISDDSLEKLLARAMSLDSSVDDNMYSDSEDSTNENEIEIKSMPNNNYGTKVISKDLTETIPNDNIDANVVSDFDKEADFKSSDEESLKYDDEAIEFDNSFVEEIYNGHNENKNVELSNDSNTDNIELGFDLSDDNIDDRFEEAYRNKMSKTPIANETVGDNVVNTVSDISAVSVNDKVDKVADKVAGIKPSPKSVSGSDSSATEVSIELPPEPIPYIFPSIELLSRPSRSGHGMTERELKDMAQKLQACLKSFKVDVKMTDIICGPTVTRYELQPALGTRVKKITELENDIKLNLAAADIRIEAPIPGKSAVGIEVPNPENVTISLREMLETKEFREHKSDVAFAVGKDIGGRNIVTDIAKMPHLLIAGATGSGKSVCINTIVMSIIYKADPNDVKLIMIDPKVVELSVYNGIPHLCIPVVTDPKKAAAALNWAVAEMNDRYSKFAELGVRDMKGFNNKIERMRENPNMYRKMPQIVIIVDELADLMMVASHDVETAICRLAQMARAAGLHLIIATQRPSVDVITGLIKANVPSRIAFAVSSAVDSRTILDGSGAEKLLGKGDMLFFPQGLPKPIRVQGAFVSDSEVAKVTDFIKNQYDEPIYDESINNKITNAELGDNSSNSSGQAIDEPDDGRDELFAEAGRFIIEKQKSSIGMLQRVFKLGFNRAARIMDQLCEAGVVSDEDGKKPRNILMSADEFEQMIREGR